MVNLKKCSIWSFYNSKEEAKNIMKEKGKEGYDTIMSFENFQEHQKNFYCSGIITQLTEAEFYRAFEVLPPLNYTKTENGFTFFMSEFITVNITTQYLKNENDYYCKTVVIDDESSHIDLLNNDLESSEEYEIYEEFSEKEYLIYEFLKDEVNYTKDDAYKCIIDRDYNVYSTDKITDVAVDIINERDDISDEMKIYIDMKMYAETLESESNFYLINNSFLIDLF